jgi:hypothetical protein
VLWFDYNRATVFAGAIATMLSSGTTEQTWQNALRITDIGSLGVRAVITKDIAAYLEETQIPLRLSCMTSSGWPMVLSLWYLYRDQALFCATQQRAKVVGYLENDARCAFEVASDQPPYCGVRGQGWASLDKVLGPEVLQQLLERYLGGTDNPLARRLLAQSHSETAIIIKPVRIFTWNFTDRMKDSIPIETVKPCPD